MQKLYVGLVVVALAAIAAPVNAAQSTYDRNLAYLMDIVGEQDLTQTVTFSDGREMTLENALAATALRAGDVDLQNIAIGAAPPPGVHGGDIWVFEYGSGSCSATVLAPGSPAFVPIDTQLWIYAGAIGELSTSNGYFTQIIGWTTKSYELGFGTAGFTATGNQDFFCFGFSGIHIAFPFIDGTASMN